MTCVQVVMISTCVGRTKQWKVKAKQLQTTPRDETATFAYVTDAPRIRRRRAKPSLAHVVGPTRPCNFLSVYDPSKRGNTSCHVTFTLKLIVSVYRLVQAAQDKLLRHHRSLA